MLNGGEEGQRARWASNEVFQVTLSCAKQFWLIILSSSVSEEVRRPGVCIALLSRERFTYR